MTNELTRLSPPVLSERWLAPWDNFFNDFFRPVAINMPQRAFVPSLDVEEDEKTFSVHVEMPGVPEENIRIELEDNVLSISGTKSRETKVSKTDYTRYERHFGSFSRSVQLPLEQIDVKQATAKMKDGVLTVVFPKSESPPKEKTTIKIEKE